MTDAQRIVLQGMVDDYKRFSGLNPAWISQAVKRAARMIKPAVTDDEALNVFLAGNSLPSV